MLAEFGSGQVLWSIVWFTLFFIWIWLLIVIFSDIFRSPDLSGWGKALWTIFVIIVPYLGVFVYLIARGRGMAERHAGAVQSAQVATDQYIQSVASRGNPAEQIASAKTLLDSGTINQDEFDKLKQKALAS